MNGHGMWRRGRSVAASVVVPAMVLLCGCQGAIRGAWHLEKATPNRDVFSIDDAVFRSDGTFTARTTIEGQTVVETGTYRFIGYHLTLNPQAGGQRDYTTMLRGRTLEIKDGERVVILRKGRKER